MHASSPTEEELEEGLPNAHGEKQSQKYFILGCFFFCHGEKLTKTKPRLTN